MTLYSALIPVAKGFERCSTSAPAAAATPAIDGLGQSATMFTRYYTHPPWRRSNAPWKDDWTQTFGKP